MNIKKINNLPSVWNEKINALTVRQLEVRTKSIIYGRTCKALIYTYSYIHICKYNKHRCVLLQTKGACSQSRLWLWKQLKRLKCALNGRLHIRVCIYKYVHINIWVSVLARAICRQLLLVVAVGRWRSCGRAANVWPSNVKSTSIKIQQFRLWLTREVSSSSSSSRNNSGKRLNRHRGISHIPTHTWYVFIYTHKHFWIWSSLRAVWLTLKKIK